MRREALASLNNKSFVLDTMFDHDEWPGILSKIVADNDLVPVSGRVPGGEMRTVYTTKQLAQTRNEQATTA